MVGFFAGRSPPRPRLGIEKDLRDRWAENLQPILALLDEGLSLYRRNFVGFMLITASWFVPVAVAIGLLIVAESYADDQYGIWFGLMAFGVALLLFFPLLIYLVGGLSRAAAAAADGRPVRFREA